MRESVVKNPSTIALFSKEMLSKKEFVLDLVKESGEALFYLPEWQDDKEVVMGSVKKDGLSLFYASYRLQNNSNIVKVALRENKESLRFSSFEIQDRIEKEGISAWLEENKSKIPQKRKMKEEHER